MESSWEENHGSLKNCLFTAAGALTLTGFSLLNLHPDDRISILLGLWLLGLGFIFYRSLFSFFYNVGMKTTAGEQFRKTYQLNSGDVLEISNKLVSAVQATLCCFSGAVVCSWSCSRHFLRSSHFMSEAYAWFGAAYFFYDIWAMYKVYYATTGSAKLKEKTTQLQRIKGYLAVHPVIVFHHVFIGSFGFLVIVYLRGGLGDCVFGFVYLMELSTPFVSIRSILSKLKMKSSRLYMINGLAMILTFLLCRVIMFPYVMMMYSNFLNTSLWQAMKTLPNGCKISLAILVAPQLYWFMLMTKGAFSVFSNSSREEKKRNDILS